MPPQARDTQPSVRILTSSAPGRDPFRDARDLVREAVYGVITSVARQRVDSIAALRAW
jgi:hypothetical protein